MPSITFQNNVHTRIIPVIQLHFPDYVKDLFATAVSICVAGGFADEELPPLTIPENLNATFTIPDKKEAIRSHRSRFNAL